MDVDVDRLFVWLFYIAELTSVYLCPDLFCKFSWIKHNALLSWCYARTSDRRLLSIAQWNGKSASSIFTFIFKPLTNFYCFNFFSMVSFITNFWIFPVTVVGNSVTNEIYFGILKWDIFPLQNCRTSSSFSVCPSFNFIQTHNSSPILSSETPNA